ncbi:unnamed protein product [Mytilus coruscus]|uniref:Reverse transcriptase zinc-binding domain-containing protein n=1 Tax=Mytilus coruscus TaxID=42192 RepID=A0A6J8C3S8_MYTCO|nr:unnamed protein product [Mytilus coruscus]
MECQRKTARSNKSITSTQKIYNLRTKKDTRAENAKLRKNDRQKLTEARTMDSKTLLPANQETKRKIKQIYRRATKALFGSICRADCTATEWKIAERQLGIKTLKGNSRFIALKTIFFKYGIQDPYTSLFDKTITKMKWKHMINQKVNTYWTERKQQDTLMFSSLQYLSGMYRIGKCHPTATTCSANIRDISRIPVRLKILTGSYILQTKRAVFNNTNPDPTCMLCGKSDETLSHFLLVCTELDNIRMTLTREIIDVCSVLFAKYKLNTNFDLLTILINPYYYYSQWNSENLISDIDQWLEPLCRCLCYKLHAKRYQLLDIPTKSRTIRKLAK